MSMTMDTRRLSLAARIKVARVGADMDQKDVAAALGVSRATISHWERGGAQPQLGQAVMLARVTGVTLDWLADGIDVNEKTPTPQSEGPLARPEGFEPPTF